MLAQRCLPATQAQGPDVGSPAPTHKLGVATIACYSAQEETETGEITGLCWPASLAW